MGPAPEPSAEERAVLQRYLDCHEREDPEALAALLREDARLLDAAAARRLGRGAT